MAIATTVIKRVFKYMSLVLPDPGENKTPDEVRQAYSAMYPELATCVVEGPVTKAGTSTYTLQRAAGSKGAATAKALQQIVDGTYKSRMGGPLDGATSNQVEECKKCSTTVKAVLGNKAASAALTPPATAYSVFG